MPKVELHLHLEGAFTFEYLFGLVEKYGGDPAIKDINDLKFFFTFKDFNHFLKTWYWKNQFYKVPIDFEDSVYNTLKNLSKQNVVYAEVFFSPWDFEANGLKVEEITEATISGIKKAENDFDIKIGLIADIVRNYGAEGAMRRLAQVTPYLNHGVIGLGLGGDEMGFPARYFQDVYKKAKDLGFRLTAHAGEADGPQSIRDAIEILNAERIGHGVRAIEDPAIIELLCKKQIPLEVCITSNLQTKIYSSVTEHPLQELYEAGVYVTVNSDDPPMFGSNITEEYLLISDKLGFSHNAIKTLCFNSINASFLDESEKLRLQTLTNEFWQDLL